MNIKERTEASIKKTILKNSSINDERQTAIVNNSAVITILLTILFLIIKMGVDYVRTKDIDIWDGILFLFIIFVFCLGCKKDKAFFVPKIKGKEINKKKDKKLRIKQYINDAIGFAVFMTILEAIGYFVIGDESIDEFHIIGSLNTTLSYIVCALLSLIGAFIIATGVNYLLGEHSVKKYNKYLDKFDD